MKQSKTYASLLLSMMVGEKNIKYILKLKEKEINRWDWLLQTIIIKIKVFNVLNLSWETKKKNFSWVEIFPTQKLHLKANNSEIPSQI